MTRPKTPSELDAARCAARSKHTGDRCRRWAVSGCTVCVVHGAGAPVRRARFLPGTPPKQDPRTARLRHGLYSRRLPDDMGRVVAEFLADEAALFDLRPMVARLWTLLVRCDEVEESAVAGADLRDPEQAAAVLRAVEGVRSVLRELVHAAKIHAQLAHRPSGIDEAQVIAMVVTVVRWADEIARDERVPRDQLGRQLQRRIEGIAERARRS
jgi:hypothetical protein